MKDLFKMYNLLESLRVWQSEHDKPIDGDTGGWIIIAQHGTNYPVASWVDYKQPGVTMFTTCRKANEAIDKFGNDLYWCFTHKIGEN